MSSSINNTLEVFSSGQLLSSLLTDVESSESASIDDLLSQLSPRETVQKLEQARLLIEENLQNLVYRDFDELLDETSKVEILESHLTVIHGKIEALMETLEKLRSRLTEPYNRVAHRIALLNRLHATCDLLRRIVRFMHLSRRLNQTDFKGADQSTINREVIKAAQFVHELNSLISQDDSLLKIDIIKSDLIHLGDKQNDILEIANTCFTNGFSKQDSSQVGVALHVYYFFNILDEKVDLFLQNKEQNIITTARDVFDMSSYNQARSTGPGSAVVPMTLAQSANFKTKLWNNIENLMEQIFIAFSQAEMLFKILKKKRDPLNQSSLLESTSKPNGLIEFITRINNFLSQTMTKANASSNIIKEVLEGEYPKILRLFTEVWKRLSRDDKDINLESMMRSVLHPFESAYLSRSLSLLFDAVNIIFMDTKESLTSSSNSLTNVREVSLPTKEDIDSLVKTLSAEMNVANLDPELSQAVAKNIGKSVQMFLVKCEKLICVEGDATQVIGPATKSQQCNATIVHRLELFKQQMEHLLSNCESNEESLNIIRGYLNNLDSLIINTIDPLMNSAQDSIEAIILTIHNEDFSNSVNGPPQCSLYMRELQGFITRVYSDYFSLFPDTPVVRNRILKVAVRTIDLFLRHATLIRPLTQNVKMRLAVDFAQLEEALSTFHQLIDDLGKHYRILRAFKLLLFHEPSSIVKSQAVGNLIPYSIVIQFLISTHGPPEMKSAHENRGWSITRYSAWIDEHSDEEQRLMLFKETLESYVMEIRRKQVTKSFPEVYTIILDILQKALVKS
ncbi:conserved oligomeric Golgi complex subunit 5 [Tetranychus urticae]|uniref:conserved oligomeric Golgi complex subunit 5 n=1 Tax=Tetranychus urticae TaxID=32264 RepID=UPI00077BE8EE|nr:conserved oligomeric Golgi complex subunit 5 [Tetranychus urticae]